MHASEPTFRPRADSSAARLAMTSREGMRLLDATVRPKRDTDRERPDEEDETADEVDRERKE